MKRKPVCPDVSRDELIEVLAAISIITKDLTRKLAASEKGGKYDVKHKAVYRNHRRASGM